MFGLSHSQSFGFSVAGVSVMCVHFLHTSIKVLLSSQRIEGQHVSMLNPCWLYFQSVRHFYPQGACSFQSASKITTSGKVQQGNRLPITLCMLRVKSDKSDWLRVSKLILYTCSKIGPSQRLQFSMLTKRNTAFGDENVFQINPKCCRIESTFICPMP